LIGVLYGQRLNTGREIVCAWFDCPGGKKFIGKFYSFSGSSRLFRHGDDYAWSAESNREETIQQMKKYGVPKETTVSGTPLEVAGGAAILAASDSYQMVRTHPVSWTLCRRWVLESLRPKVAESSQSIDCLNYGNRALFPAHAAFPINQRLQSDDQKNYQANQFQSTDTKEIGQNGVVEVVLHIKVGKNCEEVLGKQK
jgi:hypothetical protein